MYIYIYVLLLILGLSMYALVVLCAYQGYISIVIISS